MMKTNVRKILIAPSVLSADFAKLSEEIREVERAGCDMLHVDIMDGHFVPNLTIGPPVIACIRKVTQLPLDVHLMIENPLRYIEDFRKAGSDMITVHVEAMEAQELKKTIQAIKQVGANAGLSVRPKTPVDRINPYLKDLDLVLIMTVEPGFGGQSFMPEMMPKISGLRPKFSGLISVDGGINQETAAIAVKQGIDILVAGTAIFGQKDRAGAIQALRSLG